MKKNTPSERLINGIIKENPTFVLMLGMCPTLAITTSAITATSSDFRPPSGAETATEIPSEVM